MSFPKAKLQRFNDITSCSPSPALYSPAVKSTIPISKNPTKLELKSPAASDNTSVFSVNSTPCFRTPKSVPKKRKILGFMKKSKPVELFKADDNEALKDKIVECRNKDESIKELSEQIEEMKLELASKEKQSETNQNDLIKPLQEEVGRLKQELEKVSANLLERENECRLHEEERAKHQDETSELKKEHIITLHKLTIKHNCELQKLLRKIHELNKELKTVRHQHVLICKQNEEDINVVLENVACFEKFFNETVLNFTNEINQKNEEIEDVERDNCELRKQIDHLVKSHAKQIGELNLDHDKELINLRDVLEEEIKADLSAKEKEIQSLEKKIEENKNLHEKEIEKLKGDQLEELINLMVESIKGADEDMEANIKEIHVLKSRIKEIESNHNKEIEKISGKRIEDMIKVRVESMKENEAELVAKMREVNVLKNKIKEIQLEHEKEIESLSEKHQEELVNIMREMREKTSADSESTEKKICLLEKQLKDMKIDHESEIEHLNSCQNQDIITLRNILQREMKKDLQAKDKKIKSLESKVKNIQGKQKKQSGYTNEEHNQELLQLRDIMQNEAKEELVEKENEIKALENNIQKIETEHKRQMSKLLQKHIGELTNLRSILQEKVDEDSQNKGGKIKVLENRLKTFISSHEQKIAKSHKIKDDIQVLENELAELRCQHAKEIEKIQRKNEKTKHEMLSTISKLQTDFEQEKDCVQILNSKILEKQTEIKETKEKYEREIKQLKNEFDAKMKQIEEDNQESNLLLEMQLNEKFKDIEASYLQKLEQQDKQSAAILKECQAISEYNIIQTEIEKNHIKKELEEKKEEIMSLVLNNRQLQDSYELLQVAQTKLMKDLDNAKFNLEEVQKQLCTEVRKHDQYVEQMNNEKKTYQITLSTTLSTIDTLKKRLLNSDRDVEQLKAELEVCELKKLEYEGKCNQLMDELELLGKLNDDLELQHETTITIMESQIRSVQVNLLEGLENYKKHANLQITELKLRLEEKEKSLQALMDHLHDQQKVNCEAQIVISSASNELDRLEGFTTDYKFKNSRLETTLNKLHMELKSSQTTVKELEDAKTMLEEKLRAEIEAKSKLSSQMNEVELKSEEYDNLLKRLEFLQEQYDSYFNYCEYYKVKAKEYEAEIEEMGTINKKYIETCGKYDKLLQEYENICEINRTLEKKMSDHDQLLQPFKELGITPDSAAELIEDKENNVDFQNIYYLKKHNLQLLEENKTIKNQIKSQGRTIEKLKKDLATVTASPKKLKHHPNYDKENIGSPNRSLNLTLSDSPGPLRERNQ